MKHECFYDSGMYSVPEMGIYVVHENSFAAGQPFFNEPRDIVLLLRRMLREFRNAKRASDKRDMNLSRHPELAGSFL
jgi:hypothetical protein